MYVDVPPMKVTAYGAVYDFGPMIKDLLEMESPEDILMELHDLMIEHFTFSSGEVDVLALSESIFVAQLFFDSLRKVIKQKKLVKEKDS